jgi:hypothetical protein
LTAPRIVSGPTLLTGICFCAACGMAMTLRTGKSGRYRYYTCSTKARQGETGCKGRTVPMEKLDTLVADHIEQRQRTSHHGLQKRTAAHARRRLKRKNGGFWRAQFCTEVARPRRFELFSPQFRRARSYVRS